MNLKNSGDSTGFEPMTSAMPVESQHFIGVTYEGLTLVSSEIFCCGDLALVNSFVAKCSTFVNETRPRTHKGDVISLQQGFRLQLYLTCTSICAEEAQTLETSVSLCFCGEYLTLIRLFNAKFS